MYDYTSENDWLQHYGVAGMKWGVRKSTYKIGREGRLISKRKKLLEKAVRKQVSSDKWHRRWDMRGGGARILNRARRQDARARRLEAKAIKVGEDKALKYESRAAKNRYKADKNEVRSNKKELQTPRGFISEHQYRAALNAQKRASKIEYKLAKDKLYVNKTNAKLKEFSKDNAEVGKALVEKMREAEKRKKRR